MLHICGVSEISLCASKTITKLFEELTAQILKKRAKKERNIFIHTDMYNLVGEKILKYSMILQHAVTCIFLFLLNKKKFRF